MLPFGDSRLTRIAFAIFFIIILGYAYFEARGLLFGPSITVAGGTAQVDEPFVRIRGTAIRISSLAMNGKEIPVTAQGAFDQPYLLTPGLNRVLLDATDKYGRTRQEVIQIVYTPNETSGTPVTPTNTTTTPLPAATSTLHIETPAISTEAQ